MGVHRLFATPQRSRSPPATPSSNRPRHNGTMAMSRRAHCCTDISRGLVACPLRAPIQHRSRRGRPCFRLAYSQVRSDRNRTSVTHGPRALLMVLVSPSSWQSCPARYPLATCTTTQTHAAGEPPMTKAVCLQFPSPFRLPVCNPSGPSSPSHSQSGNAFIIGNRPFFRGRALSLHRP